ncbi:MAG: phosphoglycerate mutase family protein [Rhodospirillaceae bacterium]
MDILFGRHGNTFDTGDKVVWVGRETDLPLVDKGWQQARAFGSAMLRINMVPDRVYCASLQRTRGFAEAMGEVQMRWKKPVVDKRLDEIDYGKWAGQSTEEIEATPEGRYGIESWTKHDIFPAGAGWGSSEADIFAAIQSFIDEIILTAGTKEKLLVVSSNGILRFFPRLLGVANLDLPSYVMKTGHAGLISGTPGAFRVRFWNISAEALSREHLG